jgi:hypothetical protein
MMSPEKIDEVVAEIAVLMFSKLDMRANYLVIRDGKADEWNHQRLLAGEPTNLVGHQKSHIGVPLRDCQILKLTPTGEGHMEIAEPWLPILCEAGVALAFSADQLKIGHFYACARKEVEAFQASTPPDFPIN